jgi:hypothetical protein
MSRALESRGRQAIRPLPRPLESSRRRERARSRLERCDMGGALTQPAGGEESPPVTFQRAEVQRDPAR